MNYFERMLCGIREWLSRRVVSRLRRSRKRALENEVARLRAENRALVNSILGLAGIPPLRVAVAQASACAVLGCHSEEAHFADEESRLENDTTNARFFAPQNSHPNDSTGARDEAAASGFSLPAVAGPDRARGPVFDCHSERGCDQHPTRNLQLPSEPPGAPSFAPRPRQAARREEAAKGGNQQHASWPSNLPADHSSALRSNLRSRPLFNRGTREQNAATSASPLRRRSWHQIGRALEIEDFRAARRERESDTETFPEPRNIVPRV